MTIVLNGKLVQLDAPLTVLQLLERYDLPQRGVAVELDQKIVPKSRWTEVHIPDNSKLEIVHMVGGGADD